MQSRGVRPHQFFTARLGAVISARAWLRIALLTALSGLLLGGHALSQGLRWLDVTQQVSIQRDGVVVVEDTRTARADSLFSEAFICLGLSSGQSVELLPGSEGVDAKSATSAFTQSCAAGTELVIRSEQRVRELTVRFHYALSGTLDYYSDVTQWYWNILESDHAPIVRYNLTVETPGPMSEPYDAFVHRYANPEEPRVSLSQDRSRLSVAFDRVPEGEGVEIRYFMDPALFSEKGSRAGFERLLIDEHRVAGVQSRLLLKRRAEWGLIPLALLLTLAVLTFRKYLQVGREPRVDVMKYPFEPPTDLPPAAVTALQWQRFQASKMSPAFHATIMDLMRRGYGEFRSRPRNRVDIQLNLEKPVEGLLPFEADVLNFLKGASRQDGLVTHEALKRHSERRLARFMPGWAKSVRAWLESQRGGSLITEESRKAAQRYAMYAVLAALITGGVYLLTDGPARSLMVVGGVLILALGALAYTVLAAWRPEIAEEVAEWRGFKRTLTDFTRMRDAPLDFFQLWDVYYAYAAAMLVAEKYLKTLERAAPVAGADEATMVSRAAWLGAVHGRGGVRSLGGLSRSITSLSNSLSAASKTASSGGSVSGGGGGGGGGGSSGVR